MEQAMKIVPGIIARSALRSIPLAVAVMSVAVAAYAQSGNAGSGGANNVQIGAPSNGGVTSGTGAGTGLTPGVGTTGGPATGGTTGGLSGRGSGGLSGGLQAAPAPNNMRANGTSLYMSPDPRAPNVSGRAAPAR
jgi:hypothetical protein